MRVPSLKMPWARMRSFHVLVVRRSRGRGLAPHRDRVLGLAVIAGELLGVPGPQLVHAIGERFQLRDLLNGERLAEVLPPLPDPLHVGALQRLRRLVAVVGHAEVREEEVVDGTGGTPHAGLASRRRASRGTSRGARRRHACHAGRAHLSLDPRVIRPGQTASLRHTPMDSRLRGNDGLIRPVRTTSLRHPRRHHPLRHPVEPQLRPLVLLPEARALERLPPRAHQRVATHELITEPRHPAVLVDAVQPQRDLRELQRHRVQVHAVDVAVGDVVPHLLQLVGVPGVRDAPAKLALLAVEVPLRELVHRLVEERGRAHRRLADGELQDAIGRHVVRDQLLERVLDDAPGERFRGVVARRLLAVTPGQAVDERALRMHAELLPALLVAVEDLLLVAVPAEVARRHEPGAREVVRGVAGLLDLVEVLLGEEAAVGEQRSYTAPNWLMPSWA